MDVEGEYLFGESLDDPKFNETTLVHDWRNYIGRRVRDIWHTFTHEQRVALALEANDRASNEDWE